MKNKKVLQYLQLISETLANASTISYKSIDVEKRALHLVKYNSKILKANQTALVIMQKEIAAEQNMKRIPTPLLLPHYHEKVVQINISLNDANKKTGPFQTDDEIVMAKTKIEGLQIKMRKYPDIDELQTNLKELEELLQGLEMFDENGVTELFIREIACDPRAFVYFKDGNKIRVSLRTSGNIFCGENIKIFDNSPKIKKKRKDALIPAFHYKKKYYYPSSGH